MVRILDLRFKGHRFDSQLFCILTQVTHTYMPLLPQSNLVPVRVVIPIARKLTKFVIAVAMHHRLKWFIQLQAQVLKREISLQSSTLTHKL